MPGGMVQAMLAGHVAAVIVDRFPYGNALMIETPLSELPPDGLAQLAFPARAPTMAPNPALTCPAPEAGLFPETSERSLYVLYAHLQAAPDFSLDEAIACGAELGKIGQSGNALHPHLHVEVRLGPAGARFTGMAHYVANASAQEMSNYCTWRVRNIFQLVDPVVLLQRLP
ncbi:MAG: M23 family metallopeptidase [Chloroflexota bacterium]